jgi:hypothetical protein
MTTATTTTPSTSTLTVFTSIASIAPALRDLQQQQQSNNNNNNNNTSFLLQEIVDPAALSGYGGTVVFDPSKLSQESKRLLQQAEILITEPHVLAKLLLLLKKEEKENENESSSPYPLLSNLKWCQSTYAGVDPVMMAIQNNDTTSTSPSSPPSFVLTRFAGVFGPPMAEWCLGRIIAHERNFAASHQDQHDRQWRV